MANLCFTLYAVYCPEADREALYQLEAFSRLLTDRLDHQPDHRLPLAELIGPCSPDPPRNDLRETILDISRASSGRYRILFVECSSSWAPKSDAWNAYLGAHYPLLRLAYRGEEDGSEYFGIHDPDSVIQERYLVDISGLRKPDGSLGEDYCYFRDEDSLLRWLLEEYGIACSSIQEAQHSLDDLSGEETEFCALRIFEDE